MTDGTVRGFRKTAKDSLAEALRLLQGEPGLKLKEQQARLADAQDLIDTASEALDNGFSAVQDRRDAKKAAKASA